jgi:hypothetical protein
LIACAQPELVQEPLDYLRVGVDPSQEADAIVSDLRAHGFEVGHRIDERGYVAFDGARGPDSTVRVVTSRGPSLSVQVPDVRWPERLWVGLAPDLRPDFDQDGQRDVVVSIRERDRTCLVWLQVDANGFVGEVFRPQKQWGEAPCLIEIDPGWQRLLLEVSVSGGPPTARVRLPIQAKARSWALDDSPSASDRWESEVATREQAIEEARVRGDLTTTERLQAELAWLRRLRKAKQPMLEAPDHGEQAR